MIWMIGAMLILLWVAPFWWWVMLVPFVYMSLRGESAWGAAFMGASSAAIVWLAGGLYLRLAGTDGIIPRVQSMVYDEVPFLLLTAAVILAFIAGGVAALAGCLLRDALGWRSQK